MKVSGPSSASGAAGATGAKPAQGGSAASGFSISSPQSAAGASELASAGVLSTISGLEALMALQEVGTPLERRRRAVGRAGKILDALESLKIDLLEGALKPSVLEGLSRAVREQRSMTDDPKLEGLLDEVEMRAAVELAKLESARVAT